MGLEEYVLSVFILLSLIREHYCLLWIKSFVIAIFLDIIVFDQILIYILRLSKFKTDFFCKIVKIRGFFVET